MTISHSRPLISPTEEDVELPLQQMTYAASIRQVLQEEMRKDQRIFLMGEDIVFMEVRLGSHEVYSKSSVKNVCVIH